MGCVILHTYANTGVRLCVSSRLQTSCAELVMRFPAICSLLAQFLSPSTIPCMDNHNHTRPARDDTDQHVSDLKAPLVSEMLPAFLDHLRVEDRRTPTTLIRYESHIQKFITTVGDCPITGITSENLS